MGELRLEVLLEAERTGDTIAEVCRRRGISRQTFYPYRRRYEAEGIRGLDTRSRQPLRSPAQIDVDLEVEICRLRKDHPPKGKVRGYRLEDGLEEAFRRYLPPFNPSPPHDESATAAQEEFAVSATQSPLQPVGDES